MSTILVVDSDGKALAATQRKLRRDFETHIALGPRSGLQRLTEEGPYAAVIAEFSMPDMDGIEFLSRVRASWPRTTGILLSRASMGVADMLRAINEAKVFHLLSASCDEQTLQQVVAEGVRRHEELAASAADIQETCAVFAKAVHETVCWMREDVRGLLSPVLPLLRGLCARLGDPAPMMTETAFLVSILGLIALPADLLDTVVGGRGLDMDGRLAFAGHPEHAVELIRHLPKLSEVAEILRGYSNFLHVSLMPVPEEPAEMPPLPAGSAILALVMEYRMALYEHLDTPAFLARMKARGLHTAGSLEALEAELGRLDQGEVPLPLDKLQPGMIAARSVTGMRDGAEVVLVPAGYELSRTTIVFLRQTARHGQVTEPVMIRRSSLGTPAGAEA